MIQPHLPIRLPCYDFTPVTGPAFDGSFLAVATTGILLFMLAYAFHYCVTRSLHRFLCASRLPCTESHMLRLKSLDVRSGDRLVRPPASGIPDSHGVTGGVYKTRERIHRGVLIRDY